MTDQQKNIIVQTLEEKKSEIINYDIGASWAIETLKAIDLMIEQLNNKD